jgi:hypothetical protein
VPAPSERRQSPPISGSTPITRTPWHSDFTAVAQPGDEPTTTDGRQEDLQLARVFYKLARRG